MRKILFWFFLLLVFPCFGGEENGLIILKKDQVHQGDFFAFGNNIEISGVVNGDLYVAGSHIVIDGAVSGSVYAFGGSIDISGHIVKHVRVGGAQIEIQGTLEDNLIVFSGNLQILPKAIIKGDAVITAGHVDLLGTVLGDTTISASNARINGEIGENVRAYVGALSLGSQANIQGNLDYSSSSEAYIESGAKIQGETSYQPASIEDFIKGRWKRGLTGSRFAGILMNFIFSFISGLILLKVFHRKLEASILALKIYPWKSFWLGILIILLLPITCLVLFITILGLPLAIALIALSFMGFFIAKVIPICWFSNTYLTKFKLKKNSLLAFGIALVLFFLFFQIPLIGRILSFSLTPLGLGAIFLGRIKKKSK